MAAAVRQGQRESGGAGGGRGGAPCVRSARSLGGAKLRRPRRRGNREGVAAAGGVQGTAGAGVTPGLRRAVAIAENIAMPVPLLRRRTTPSRGGATSAAAAAAARPSRVRRSRRLRSGIVRAFALLAAAAAAASCRAAAPVRSPRSCAVLRSALPLELGGGGEGCAGRSSDDDSSRDRPPDGPPARLTPAAHSMARESGWSWTPASARAWRSQHRERATGVMRQGHACTRARRRAASMGAPAQTVPSAAAVTPRRSADRGPRSPGAALGSRCDAVQRAPPRAPRAQMVAALGATLAGTTPPGRAEARGSAAAFDATVNGRGRHANRAARSMETGRAPREWQRLLCPRTHTA